MSKGPFQYIHVVLPVHRKCRFEMILWPSYLHLISMRGYSTLVRWHLYIERGPSYQYCVCWWSGATHHLTISGYDTNLGYADIDGLVQNDVTPLLIHWSYVFLALTHWYVGVFQGWVCIGASDGLWLGQSSWDVLTVSYHIGGSAWKYYITRALIQYKEVILPV